MSKQKLEGIFSASMKQIPDVFCIKLQVNQMAYHQMPADFIVHHRKILYLVECKQVTCDMFGKGAYAFARLSQEQALINFNNKEENRASYILIMYYTGDIRKSDIYLVPIAKYLEIKNSIGKLSININDAKELFSSFKREVLKGGIIKWLDE